MGQPVASGASNPMSSPGAALYQSAIANMHRHNADLGLPSPPPSRGNGSVKPVPAYPSAEEEKAALRRYHEAKNAVSRTQGLQSPVQSPVADPVSYDTLYPRRSSPNNAPPSGNPPPFIPSAQPPSGSQILNEKERLRRAYEAQDAALQQAQQQAPPPPIQSPAYSSPPAAFIVPGYAQAPMGPPGAGPNGFLSEKELLRQKFNADDAVAAMNASPSRNPSMSMPTPQLRNQPSIDAAPPVGSSNILSAMEEKARLRAKYDAEERAANGNSSAPPEASYPATSSMPVPPFRQPPYTAAPPTRQPSYRSPARQPSYSATSPPARQPSYSAAPPTAYHTPMTELPQPSFGQIPIKNTNIPAPPPLAPRPPAEYIQETQEVDARVRRDSSPLVDEVPELKSLTHQASSHELDLRPFTPFTVGIHEPGPPPPLPPKRFDSIHSMDQ